MSNIVDIGTKYKGKLVEPDGKYAKQQTRIDATAHAIISITRGMGFSKISEGTLFKVIKRLKDLDFILYPEQ